MRQRRWWLLPKNSGPKKEVVTLKHEEASRRNIPTAEFQSVMQPEELNPISVTYERDGKGLEHEKEQRNRDGPAARVAREG